MLPKGQLMQKDHDKSKESSNDLWINFPNFYSFEDNWKLSLFLWRCSWSTLTLTKALQKVSDDVRVVLSHTLSRGTFTVDSDALIPCSMPKKLDFWTREYYAPRIQWNSLWFRKYIENKWLTYKILKKKGIPLPKQELLKMHGNKDTQSISSIAFHRKLSGGSVIKPTNGALWKDVHIIPADNQIFPCISQLKDQAYIHQERIHSYPIQIDKKKKDWNLRVIVSYDPDKKDYIVVWSVWRIDKDGGPVNLSITAKHISFDDISELCWWTKKQFREVKKKVASASINSVKAIIDAWARKKTWKRLSSNIQVVSWVDVIVDQDMNPFVIEVNDAWIGGIYELYKSDWLDAIIPIAESIVHKINLVRWQIDEK